MRNFDDFDKQFNRMQKFAVGWTVFVALIAIAILSGIAFVAFKLLTFWGVF